MIRGGPCMVRARTSAPAGVVAGKVAGRRPRSVWRGVRQILVGSLLLPGGCLVVLAAWSCTALMRLARAVRRSGHSRPVAWEQGPGLALLLVLMAWPCAASGAVAHLGRQLQATPNVFNSSELTAAVHGDSLDHLVLAPGVYEMDPSDVCTTSSSSWLCVNRDNLIIEAAEPGSVVLNATKQGRRVLYITASGAELIGLNITGGEASTVGAHFEPSGPFFQRPIEL